MADQQRRSRGPARRREAGPAQNVGAGIQGSVTDASGAVLPGVRIVVRNVATAASWDKVTDPSGRYQLPLLPPGEYEVRAELSNFRPAVRRGIHLAVGQAAVVDLALELGGRADEITIEADVSGVDHTSAAISGLVGEREIRDLPLNGRSFQQLALLQPGVSAALSAGNDVVGGRTPKISVNGARPEQNSFLLDGTDINNVYNKTPGSVAGVLLGVDAVLEFQVLTNAYSAEFGRSAGGVISAVTRGGANALHGSVFEFHRNSALDARNFFDPPSQPKPDFWRHQFGATLGGPVARDRTFFFLTYEGLIERLGVTGVTAVPDDDARRGTVGGRSVGLHPAVPAYLDLLFPRANGRSLDPHHLHHRGRRVLRRGGEAATRITLLSARVPRAGKFTGRVSPRASRRGVYLDRSRRSRWPQNRPLVVGLAGMSGAAEGRRTRAGRRRRGGGESGAAAGTRAGRWLASWGRGGGGGPAAVAEERRERRSRRDGAAARTRATADRDGRDDGTAAALGNREHPAAGRAPRAAARSAPRRSPPRPGRRRRRPPRRRPAPPRPVGITSGSRPVLTSPSSAAGQLARGDRQLAGRLEDGALSRASVAQDRRSRGGPTPRSHRETRARYAGRQAPRRPSARAPSPSAPRAAALLLTPNCAYNFPGDGRMQGWWRKHVVDGKAIHARVAWDNGRWYASVIDEPRSRSRVPFDSDQEEAARARADELVLAVYPHECNCDPWSQKLPI